MSELNSMQHVANWVAEQQDGVDELRRAIATGRFIGPNSTMAIAWLADFDRKEEAKQRTEALAAAARSTAAAEASAKATEKAARWTFWAAIAAAVGAAVPLVQTIALVLKG